MGVTHGIKPVERSPFYGIWRICGGCDYFDSFLCKDSCFLHLNLQFIGLHSGSLCVTGTITVHYQCNVIDNINITSFTVIFDNAQSRSPSRPRVEPPEVPRRCY